MDRFLHQFVGIKIYDINRLCIDFRPECLKLRHRKFFFIDLKLHIVAAGVFRLHSFGIIDRVDDLHNGSRAVCHFFCNLQNAISLVFVILIGQCSLLVDIAVNSQIIHNRVCNIFIDHLLMTARILDDLSNKQIYCNRTRTICHSLCNFTLQTFRKRVIAFAGDYRKNIDVMHIIAQNICILTFAVLIDA